jgi:glutamine phosphoribosylpyrophosphate amidotransferase
MCGIAGYVNIKNTEARFKLVTALGRGIDMRGQAMAGYVSSTKDDLIHARKQGSWSSADDEFILRAAHGDLCMMHSRAPGYGHPITNAHPFPIVRNDEVVLYGAHNGSLNEAAESARIHNREMTVDSKELFELLADGEFDTMNKYHGWGVIEWILASNTHEVRLSRLTQHSDVVAVEVEGGGTVWASTWNILRAALNAAGLEVRSQYQVNDVGRVYAINKDGLFPLEQTNARLAY